MGHAAEKEMNECSVLLLVIA